VGSRRSAPSEPVGLLVVGLGNPEAGYARTRHNAGFMVVNVLAERHGFRRAARKFHGSYAAGEIAGRGVGLLQPTTYMNASGKSVAAALRDLGLDGERLLVVHDEIDLAFGRLQVRHDGGHGGHNGLRSLHELVGKEFDRVRVGVGRPPSTDPDVVADYVLSPFDEPREAVAAHVDAAADLAEAWVGGGLDAAVAATV
jgi:peptidyl-tRNA hydrolase, PTH1 family